MSFAKKILRNTAFNIVGRFWLLAANLVVIPFIISHLGTEVYGIWALMLVVSGSYTLFDLGIGNSIVKFVSESLTLEDYAEVNRIVSTSVFSSLLFSSLVAAAAYPALPWLAEHVFTIRGDLVLQTSIALRFSLLTFVLSAYANLMQSVLYGAQKMGTVNSIIVGIATLSVAGAIIAIKSGYGLIGLVVNQVVWSAASAAASMYAVYKKIPVLELKTRHMDKQCLRKILPYGSKLQVVTVTGFSMEQLNKVFLGIFANMKAVAFFDIAMKIVNVVRLPSMLLLSAIVPSVSELHALQDKQRLFTLYHRGLKYLTFLSVPVATVAILSAYPFVSIFLKENLGPAVISVQVLTFCYTVHLFTGIGTTFARGIGNPNLEMQYAVVSALMNLLLVILLGKLYGYYGVIAGLSVAVIAGSIFFFIRFNRFSRGIFYSDHSETRKFLLRIASPSVVVLAAAWLFHHIDPFHGEYESISGLVLSGLYAFLFIFLVVRYSLLDSTDRAFIRTAVEMFQRGER